MLANKTKKNPSPAKRGDKATLKRKAACMLQILTASADVGEQN
jgi:hypothetical protein